jgi:hypothetical protein
MANIATKQTLVYNINPKTVYLLIEQRDILGDLENLYISSPFYSPFYTKYSAFSSFIEILTTIFSRVKSVLKGFHEFIYFSTINVSN